MQHKTKLQELLKKNNNKINKSCPHHRKIPSNIYTSSTENVIVQEKLLRGSLSTRLSCDHYPHMPSVQLHHDTTRKKKKIEMKCCLMVA